MKVLIWIIFIILLIISFFLIRSIRKHKKLIIDTFKNGNVVVYGLRGCGKDMMFQYVIACRNEDYFANIDYGYKFNNISISELNVGNTFINFIEDRVNIVDKVENREGKDVYLSDVGIYLPSQHDKLLHTRYTGLPIYYALSRHLYNSNIFVNAQRLERVWKPLREQADSFVKCCSCTKVLNFFIIKYIVYDMEETAVQGIRSLKKPLIAKKDLKFKIEEFNAKYGNIQEGFLIVPKRCLKYDTRAFHEKIFGKKFHE